MKNIFKRNKTYYYRSTIPADLRFYFKNKKEYVKSLGVKNINNAKTITRHLNKKLNLLKEIFKMLTHKEILQLIKEFENTNIENIIARNSHLTQKELNKQIIELLEKNNLNLIKDEMEEAFNFLTQKDEELIEFGINEKLGNEFEKQMYQIKTNALNRINQSRNTKNNIKKTTIEEEIQKYLAQRILGHDKREKDIIRELNFFEKYFKENNIIFIQDLEYDDLPKYREHMKNSRKLKTSTRINYSTLIVGFLSYCNKKKKNIDLSTLDFVPTLSISEKLDKKSPFTNEDVKLILKNKEKFGLTNKLNKKKKNYKEYEIILKIAIFTGARQSEICQLTKDDIIQDEKSGIWYFDFNVNNKKHLKNFYSVRKVPIHSAILKSILNYIKNKNGNLFNTKDYDVSQDFREFKMKIGFDEKKDFHSFRRTLQNELKQNEVSLFVLDEIVGHEIKGNKTTDGYTEKYTLEVKKKHLETLNFS